MTNYTKITNFANKDSLTPGDANKKVKGAEIDAEFNAIASASSTKADIASPTFTGTPAAPTAATGTNTTQIATTAFVQTELVAKPRIVSYNHVQKASNTSNTSQTEFDIGLSVTLSPANASNKLLIIAVVHGFNRAGDDAGFESSLFLDSVKQFETSNSFYSASSSVSQAGTDASLTFVYEHSPGSTASLDIDVKANATFAGSSTSVIYAAGTSLTVLEIEP